MSRELRDRSSFAVHSRWNKDTRSHYRVQEACCSSCGRTEEIADHSDRLKPVSVMAGYFRRQGWHIAARRAGDLCPTCCTSKPKARDLPAVGANDTTPQEPVMQAEPPRVATREDRRRITDALDDHYDPKANRYLKNFSDKVVAEKLKVPAAWVAEVREFSFGPNVNEAQDPHLQKLAELDTRATRLEATGRAAMAQAETVLEESAKLREDIDKLFAALGVASAA